MNKNNTFLTAKAWTAEVERLRTYFAGIDLPKEIRLNRHLTINHPELSVRDHFSILGDKPSLENLPYLNRLQRVEKILKAQHKAAQRQCGHGGQSIITN